ncbi:MRPL15 [Bugula neritina]|uniref:Large ribosomal subunit protein uL15m n=1 Tax=Bugula neritina TaxID=10212 RepID=A0A7J7J188_BUGNE|nr:MRPL15 [Bugula neritina]
MIDLGRVDVNRPIDITALCNSQLIKVDRELNQYGIHLTDEGADVFDAKVFLEVQWVDEVAVAAIEKSGSLVRSRYYDPKSLSAAINPAKFFGFGKPIPTCKTPTVDVLEYYSGARGRGYLADTSEIEKDKIEMAQKYGYSIPELCDRVQQLAMESKNELQIFYGLQPGWIVNLADKEILKPVDPELQKLYNTNSVLV